METADLLDEVRIRLLSLESAQREATQWRNRAVGLESDRDEWRTRALAAETALVERNRELDAAKAALRNERLIADGLRKDFELAQEAAHKVATMAAEEAASLRAQVESLRGALVGIRDGIEDGEGAGNASIRAISAVGPSPRGGAELLAKLGDARRLQDRLERQRTTEMLELIASLPSPSSPETSWLKAWWKHDAARICKHHSTMELITSMACGTTSNGSPEGTEASRAGVQGALGDPPGSRTSVPPSSSVVCRCGHGRDQHVEVNGCIMGWQANATGEGCRCEKFEPPSPSSPKTGRWKCRGCGKELLATAWTGSGSRWALSFDAKTWIHWCENNLGSSPADRISDAPEVTP